MITYYQSQREGAAENMLRLVLGGAGSGKTRWIYDDIRRRMSGSRDLVLLTPEQQSHRAERELAAACGPALSLHAEVLSFTRMYDRVAAQTGGLADLTPDKSGRLLLMARALEAAGPGLRHYGGRRRTDFLTALLDTAQELRDALIPPEALLEAAARGEGTVADKLHDMGVVLAAYQAELARSLGDSRDRVQRLADSVYDSTVGVGGVWLDGFTDFTACELQVIDQLLRRGGPVTVALTLGEGEAAHFRLTEGTYQELMSLAARRGEAVEHIRLTGLGEGERQAPAPDLRYLAENLYQAEAKPLKRPSGAVELCHMHSFPGECRWAAARILGLLRADESLRYRDFALCAADFPGGRTAMETALEEYGIPYFIEETSSLREKGLTAFVLEALAVVNEGWRARNVFRCLKTGLAGLTVEETDLLENYCLTWSIRGERAWRQEAPWDRSPRGYVPELSPADRQTLAAVDGLRRRVAEPLGRLADALRGEQPAAAQLEALAAYFSEVGLADALAARAVRLAKAGRAAEARECPRLWEALTACLEQFYAALGDAVLTGGEFARLLELVLEQKDVGAIPAALDCVAVGSVRRLRGVKPRVLLLLGADDAALPGGPEAGGLFSVEERRTLFELGIPLQRDRDEAVCRPLYDLYACAASPTERLLVSYAGGEDQRPCLLMTRAMALLGAVCQTEESLGGAQLAAAAGPLVRLALSGDTPLARAAAACLAEEQLADLRLAARQPRGALEPDTVRALYGAVFQLTASRAETFHACRYQYFMQYGLRARERKPAGFQAPELGTFVHFVLEHVCREAVAQGGFGGLEKEALQALAAKYTEEYTKLYFRPAQLEDPRFLYLFRRLQGAVDAIVLDVAGELAVSDFQPLDFELRFAGDGALPPVQIGDLRISGAVDRVDGWLHDGRLYLCVADYKTGRKQFSLTDVWYGLGIQMLVYLFVLAAHGQDRYGHPLAPAGVLYAPARDVLLSMPRCATEAEIAAKKAETLRRSGLLLADKALLEAREHGEAPRYLPVKYRDGVPVGSVATAAQLGDLAAYVKRLLERMGQALRAGRVDAEPLYKSKTAGPCQWCPYGSACAFDREKDRLRLERTVPEDAFWQGIAAGEEDHG